MAEAIRHICGISGGKDSSALAVHLRGKVPDLEYFFCDTGAELPETYEYLVRLEVILGKPIVRLNAGRGFDHWFEVFRGTLPSPQMRWCTKNMKIKPIEAWIGDSPAISYVAIRADESNRKGYISTKPNIRTQFPFIEDGVDRDGVNAEFSLTRGSACRPTMNGEHGQAATSVSISERRSGSGWRTATRSCSTVPLPSNGRCWVTPGSTATPTSAAGPCGAGRTHGPVVRLFQNYSRVGARYSNDITPRSPEPL